MYGKTGRLHEPCHCLLVDVSFFSPKYDRLRHGEDLLQWRNGKKKQKGILAIPGTEIAEAVLGCGSTTGRDTDKIAKFGIEMVNVEGSSIQIPKHSRVAIVCNLKEYHEVGDHYLYICDVEQVYGNEGEKALFAWNGYSQLRSVE